MLPMSRGFMHQRLHCFYSESRCMYKILKSVSAQKYSDLSKRAHACSALLLFIYPNKHETERMWNTSQAHLYLNV